MPAPFRLWENAQVVELLSPAADSAGRTSSYISVKYGQKAFIVCFITQGSSSTILLSPLQASDSAGATSKAITAAPIAACLDTVTSDQFTIEAAAATFTTDAGVKHKIIIFEIQPEECMDINNTIKPFQYIAVSTGASSASNITSALLIVYPLRDQRQKPPTTTGI